MTIQKSWRLRLTNITAFSYLGKEFFWVILGEGTSVVGSVVGLRLLTDYLSPAVFGEIALVMTIAVLVNQTILGPLAGAALRFLSPAEEASSTGDYLHALQSMIVRVSGFTLLAVAAVSLGLFLWQRLDWVFFLISAITYALLTGFAQILNGMQNALRQRKIVAWHSAMGQWLQVGLVLTAVIYFGPTSRSAMIGYVAAAFLILPSQMYFFRRKVLTLPGMATPASQPDTQTALWRRKLRDYALPFAGWGIFTWAQMSSDRWSLQASGSTSEVGYYAVLYRLGYYPITLATGLVIQLISPILFQKAGDATDENRMKATLRVNQGLTTAAFSVTLIAVMLAYFLHPLLFRVLVSSEYRSISWLLPWIMLAGGLFATGQVATISLLSEVNTKRLLPPKIGTAVLATALNFAAAFLYGLPGVIFAGVISGAVYVVWILALIRQNNRQTRRLTSQKAQDALQTEEDK
ncbi:MAG: oligosaccharide flippase family protein [Chloroflexi bacterium]|nr:oligosaccharide flippase family protein [Chloroflexota bacterium]